MRQGLLSLPLVLMLASSSLPAEEAQNEQVPDRQAELENRLSENLQRRETLRDNPEVTASATGQAQLARLRQENQRLRLQLEELQSRPQSAPQLLTDDQQWFAVGGGVGVLGFLLGVLTTRGRRRRQWLN
ncbi:hypothetical protein [Stutzerimonas stutzeri]|uniref:hypothetical protein n=1 Tax=Stutzerimonas stutzeri TaxID=316 RepID=UPI002108B8B4|nr:hypothetical protein [Stutzerimonas stutzeri]MCQ4259537.1 hypothetical protein [Stutzerimonas stutzeri]